jgi:hypothetical protein
MINDYCVCLSLYAEMFIALYWNICIYILLGFSVFEELIVPSILIGFSLVRVKLPSVVNVLDA